MRYVDRKRSILILFFIAVFGLISFQACAQVNEPSESDENTNGSFEHKLQNTTVTLEVSDASVLRTLRNISEKTGVAVQVGSGIRAQLNEESTTVEVENVPLQTLLTVILKSKGYHHTTDGERVVCGAG